MAGNYSSLGLGGCAPTRAIVNAFSSSGTYINNINASSSTNMAKEVLSGPLTANVLSTLLSITVPGQIPFLTAYTKDATSRTLRLQVIVDGAIVFDAAASNISSTYYGLVAAGQAAGTALGPGNPIRFNSSCVVKVASSLTETDKVAVGYCLN